MMSALARHSVAILLAFSMQLQAETFTNRSTNETVTGKLMDTVGEDAKQMYFVKTDDGKTRYLPKAQWTVGGNAATPSAPKDNANEPKSSPVTEVGGLKRITTTGAGTTPDDALKSALVGAVEQAVGVLVEAETIVKNDAIIKEKIITATNAFVEKYDLVKRWQEDQVHLCRITAYVRTRQLRERLEANKIATKKVEGENIHARIVTEEQAKKSAAEIVEECLADFPQKVLTVRATGKPVPITASRLRLPIEVALDAKAYAQVMQDVLPKLRHIARLEMSGTVRFQRLQPVKKGGSDSIFRGGCLRARDLEGLDSNPVFPAPGYLEPLVWFAPAQQQIRNQVDAIEGLLIKKATERGQRLGLVTMFTGVANTGAISIAVFGVDEEALALLPQAGRSEAVVRLVLLNGARKEVASREIRYLFADSAAFTDGAFLLRTRDSAGHGWPRVTVVPGSYYGGGLFNSCSYTSVSQSWHGFAYIDIGADQIKQVESLDVSVGWEPTK